MEEKIRLKYFVAKVKEIKMAKKSLVLLVLVVFVAGGVFAQENTITVDIGPTIVGLALGQMGKVAEKMIGEEVGLNSAGFGIAAQYERQILRQWAIAVRGAYLGAGFDMGESVTESGISASYSIGLDMKTISAEGHARFYPAGNIFFLGGMVGYGNLMMGMDGNVSVRGQYSGQTINESEKVSFTALRNYIKVGPRVGWRIDFGRPGGFVFEPSLGYDFAFGLGDTFVKQLEDKVTGDIADINELGDMFKIIENYALVGGPRVTLGFGFRF